MSFWDDFATGFTGTIKDIGTSATRVVTDTAIDLGNVATGFQYQDNMDEAKKAFSNAGVLSASEAIEKNYYSFLPEMREQAQAEHDELTRLYPLAKSAEQTCTEAYSKLEKMLDDIKILAQANLEAETVFAKASQIPYWQEWAKSSNVPVNILANLKSSCAAWDVVCQEILTSRGVADIGDNVSATPWITCSRIAEASAVVKESEVSKVGAADGKTAEVSGTEEKLARIREITGRASAVLAVTSTGLDVGLSVAQLEDQKRTLQQNIEVLNQGIAIANQDIADMTQETSHINSEIQELLRGGTPPVEESDWDTWVRQQENIISAALTKLTSALDLYERAFWMANAHSNRSYDERIEDVKSVDESITDDQAKQIIAAADGTVPSLPIEILGDYECHLYDGTDKKNDWHYVTISKINDTTLKWANRAGVSWTLTTTPDKTKLDVGSDCSYYKNYGHKQVTVVWDGKRVLGLKGPFDEMYDKFI